MPSAPSAWNPRMRCYTWDDVEADEEVEEEEESEEDDSDEDEDAETEYEWGVDTDEEVWADEEEEYEGGISIFEMGNVRIMSDRRVFVAGRMIGSFDGEFKSFDCDSRGVMFINGIRIN